MRELFNEKQKTIIINNYENMSYYEIAELLGDQYTERQIRGWINNNGFRKLRKINDHYFDVIDDQIKAYYLGFIYADGWIINNPTRRCYELGMQSQKQDKYILDRLNMELGHKNNVIIVPERKTIINGIETISSESAKIRISSKNLVIGLEKNGIVQNKTNSCIFPKPPKKFFFDYLRGYIDGDGCYYYNKGYLNVHITCSNPDNLEYIKNELYEYNIKSSIYCEKEKKYRLMIFGCSSVQQLINSLYYNNCLCLERKYNKIKDHIGLAVQ